MKSEHEPPPHCLDAETMAAWVDHALPTAEAAAAEAHVADCARCQAVLAVLVKTLPAAVQPVAWWRRRWAIGALVPLAASAVALAVWIATPRQPASQQIATLTTSTTPAASAPPATPAATAESPRAPAAAATADAKRAQAPALADRIERAPVAPAARPGVASTPATADARDIPARAKVDEFRRADAAPAASPAASPPPAAAPPAEARQATAARALESNLNKVAASVEVVSPDPSVRWRIGASGSIQRSADGGATWVGQASGVAQDLTAGISPQRGVCWVVGRAGTVLLLTNPNLWRRLEFPETVDLAQVAARDGLAATVTAADGRRFQTADGGQTWTRLQDF